MTHIVLLGDSILDNRAYVAGGRAVTDHLRAQLPAAWRATLLAVDGSTVASVARQLTKVPPDATHLVLSVGGNDALMASGVLVEPAASVGAALARLAAIQATFETAYATMLDQVLAQQLPTTVCTIYYPHMAEPNTQLVIKTGLLPFNDTILRLAARAHLPVLDLRAVCTTSTDYANEIEPSDSGGAKIAKYLLSIVQTHSFKHGHTMLYP